MSALIIRDIFFTYDENSSSDDHEYNEDDEPTASHGMIMLNDHDVICIQQKDANTHVHLIISELRQIVAYVEAELAVRAEKTKRYQEHEESNF